MPRMPTLFWLPLTVAGAVGLGGALLDWPLFLSGWLTAALTWIALPLGALAVLMTHGLTGGRWGDQTLPVWRALAATLPLSVAAMMPLLFGLNELFPWTQPESTLPEVVRNKRLYLNPGFFIARTLGFFILWLGLVVMLLRRSPKRLHGPGLLLWLLSLTFFSVDWLMSLEPTFYSDVFGLIFATSAIGAAMAMGLLLRAGRGDPTATRDLLGLWLAVVIGWAFLAFSQYIIIWHGNLPHEIGWYVHRSEGHWRTLGVVSFGLFCAGPLIALLAGQRTRRSLLALAAVVTLAGFVLRTQWLVMPAFPRADLIWHGFTWLATFALGAAHVGMAFASLKQQEAHHD
ncbi:hypothetical protein [Marinimicrobium locisalis]|uniref:hypothetical protein n=1 Tax=Marinimicrobium locisalis TaxID=546022 RepID=UPI0032218A5A